MSHDEKLIKSLEEKANTLRKHCFTIFDAPKQGHVGGTMSVIDIVTALYFHHIKFDPQNTDDPERDRVVLSKAHSCEAIYAALVELGVYPPETLNKYYCYGSPFQGHADRWCTRGIDFSGGSLGQGISFAAGLAYAEKLQTSIKMQEEGTGKFGTFYIARHNPLYRTYCILGDGECNEGQVWEAAMFAAKYKLDNLVVIVDYNKFCLDGPSNDIMLEPVSVAVHTVDRANITTGKTVIISGAGPIGLLTLQMAVKAGAARVLVSEPVAEKRALATRLGADLTVDPINEDLEKISKDFTDGYYFDTVIEASGNLGAAKQSLSLAGKGGTVVWASVYPDDKDIAVNPFHMYAYELTISSVYLSPYSFPRALKLLPKLDLKPLITNVYPLDDIVEAFKYHRSGKPIKILIKCSS